MIKKLLLIILILFGQKTFAQITITTSEYADLFAPGRTWGLFSNDSLSGVTMDIGVASNSPQNWSFPAGIQFKDTSFYVNIDPSTSPFVGDFPAATHASSFSFEAEEFSVTTYLFFSISDNSVVSLGGGTALNGIPFLTQERRDTLFYFPISLGSEKVSRDTIVNEGGVIVVDFSNEFIDAYGTITMPGGTFDALRAISTSEVNTYVDGTLTNTENSSVVNFITRSGSVTFDLETDSEFSGVVSITGVTLTSFGNPTSIENYNKIEPNSFALNQNYPNPFNPETVINYTIGSDQIREINVSQQSGGVLVQLKVYDMLGREVATLVNREQNPGQYSVRFNASKLSSGTYLYKLQAGDFTETKKMLLLH